MPRSPLVLDALVGRRIGARRAALGLSQSALAQRLGLSAQQVQKYEAGSNRISASRLAQVAAVLGVAPGALFPEPDGPFSSQGSEDAVDPAILMRTPEGRRLAAAFPAIEDRGLRRALARIAEALAPSGAS